MGRRLGKQSIKFTNCPMIIGAYSVVGKKESAGALGQFFDYVIKNEEFDQKSYELAERKMLEFSILSAIQNANLNVDEIDLLLSGDLLNQIISSSFSARQLDTTYLGLYGACSTMAETLAVGSCFIDGKYFKNVACSTGSHFATAERQYRYPLELGNQRPPTSQWTVTGAGCSVLGLSGQGNQITMATFGKVTDYGIKDANNMGAAMAPAAMRTLVAHFEDTKTTPDDYDLILTGDLGRLGSDILRDLMATKDYKLGKNYNDCGAMIYKPDQKTMQGGSGTGCSAVVLNGYIDKEMKKGKFNKVLFCATGALLSPSSTQQGESVPGICHAVVIERGGSLKK